MAVAFQRNTGLLVLAIWLILYGVASFVSLGLPPALMGILALIAGVLILVGR
jgi:ABC-type amino acid transport system permease subunit